MSNGTETVAADTYIGDNGVLQENWLDNFPEGTFEKDGTGKLMTANLADHKDLTGLVKSFVGQHKLVGSAIQPLKDDATPAQKAEFHQKFGCPKTIAEYELKAPTELPEGMEYRQDLVDAVSAVALGEGVSKTAMQKLATSFNAWQIENFKTQATKRQADIEKTFNEGDAALKVKWGDDYDKNIEIINKLTTQIPALANIVKLVFDISGKGNHPVVHEALFEAALKILPDSVVTGGVKEGKTTVPGQLDYTTVVGK